MAAFYRKDSSLSNDVFESVDVAPPGVLNGDEAVGRPETVPEETSSLTNSTSVEPTADLPTEYTDEPSQHISTLPVKTGACCFCLYTVSQRKQDTKLLAITSLADSVENLQQIHI